VSAAQVRPADEAELPLLIRRLGQAQFFADRFRRQREGRGVLLIAWLGPEPVGDIYLWLEPAEEPEIREQLPGVPLLNHLEVAPQHWNQGIGTAILTTAEQILRERGHRRVILGVRIENLDAQRLYGRLQYKEWEHSPISTMSLSYLETGEAVREPEDCAIYIKEL
jgi:GNAT superfamily N-acetyltransferase